MSKRQITIKPTCMRELLAFPADRAAVLWEKVNLLVTDPLPDGKVKKKLQGHEGIYRLRVGDHRVFYQFGPDWVSLLGIRRRTEDTYGAVPSGEDRPDLPPDADVDLDEALAPKAAPVFDFSKSEEGRALPKKLTREWLASLGIAAGEQAPLVRCRTEDELMEAAVSSETLARVLDALFPPALDRVAAQPDLVVPSPQDLVRFKEGDLVGFLLHLDEEQRRLTSWALAGPTMVTGGAGTGKSTVALYRVKEVLERKGTTGRERVLFTTYTRALLTATRQLLEQLLTPEQLGRVQVSTCDQVALDIAGSRRRVGAFESDGDAMRRLRGLRKTFVPSAPSQFEGRLRSRALARLSDQYLLEEFDWILTGRGLETEGEYQRAPRPGRGVAFPSRLRAAVWELYRAFQASRRAERFPDLRSEALSIVRSPGWTGHWDYVLVDEAQDLSPAALALMAEVCRTPEGLFFAADDKQSLYSRNYGWTSAHPRLQFRGRTASLKRNYRSTAEIEAAAFPLLLAEEGAEVTPSESVHEGPLPVLVTGMTPGGEAPWIVRFVRQASRHLHLRPAAAAVLVPNAEIGEALAASLSDSGLPAKYFKGREIDLRADVVKVLTLFSAKGLEFPTVVCAGFYEGTYPVRDDFDDPELFAERVRNERRLLYVGFTRAMRALMVVVPAGCLHEALVGLDHSRWHLEEAPG